MEVRSSEGLAALAWHDAALQGDADIGSHPKHGFLLEPCFVRRDQLLDGGLRGGARRVHEAEDVRRLLDYSTGSGAPLPGGMPGGETFRESRCDGLTKKLGPVFWADAPGRFVCSEVQQALNCGLLTARARW